MTDIDQQREPLFRLLARMAEAHGTPGGEGPVRRIFREELPGNTRTDRMGNIIHEERGSSGSPRIMLAAHMDEVGFVVQSITPDGLLKFMPVGGWWAHTLPSMRVNVLNAAGIPVVGVIGAKPPHFLSDAERDKVMKIEDMFIDIGAVSLEDVRERFGIRLGDAVVPASPFTPMHDPDLLLCKGFDDRAGLSLVVRIAQILEPADHPNTIFAVGTVQEEVGSRGAKTVCTDIDPDVALVFEGTPADDLPGIGEHERQGALGRGVQIRLLDPSAIANRGLARYAIRKAEELGIPHQIAVRRSGGTDAASLHLHGAGVPTLVLGIPVRYIHTAQSIVHMADILSALRLADALIRSIDTPTTREFTVFDD